MSNEYSNSFPQDLQDFIGSADENGVILFSFGGNIQSSDMTIEKVKMFYNVFTKLNQKIIWKWESSEIPLGKPDNVHMVKWLPQIDLLAQPQIKFFISHCGTGGVYEAKFHGVPILGIVRSLSSGFYEEKKLFYELYFMFVILYS